jgi:hypothetical protein
VGSLAFGRHLLPGAPLGGAHSAAELRKIAATLKYLTPVKSHQIRS